jgi:SulP family sulfate permease
MPPIYGLYAAIVPLVIYALLGTSRQLSVGPVAMVSLLVAEGIGSLQPTSVEQYIALCITLAFMVGLLQFSFGLLRLGFLANFLSHPVTSGFTTAAALIIALSQLKSLLGIDLTNSKYIHEIIFELSSRLGETHIPTLLIGFLSIVLIFLLRKWNKSFPGALLAVIIGILFAAYSGASSSGIKIIGDIPAGLPPFSFPAINAENFTALFPTALTIALVGFMESIAVAKAIQSRHRNYKVDANQELVALGMANIGGALFSSTPTTGGFSRTAVNEEAGARTGMASIFAAALILLTLIFLTPLFYHLPYAVLAAVIMVAVIGLIDYKEIRFLWKADRRDLAMLAIALLGTLSLGIEKGILLGVLMSLVYIIYETSRPHYAIQGRMPGTSIYKNIERFPEAEQREEILIFRQDERLYFANVNFFIDTLNDLLHEKGDKLKLLVINAESMNTIDSSGLHALHSVLDICQQRQVRMVITDVKGPVRDSLTSGGLYQAIGETNFYLSVSEAVQGFDSGKFSEYPQISTQTGKHIPSDTHENKNIRL